MKHLAIIADGNRRWAEKNKLPKKMAYAQGLVIIENCCDWAIQNNVKYLTVYCLSTENLRRSKEEIDIIIKSAYQYLDSQKDWYINKGIQVHFIGRRDRLDEDIFKRIDLLEQDTEQGNNLILTICFDYGGRDEIVRAISLGAKTEEQITAILNKYSPEPDVILRTGGQYRLSNFLTWQSIYSELFFLDTLFPELQTEQLTKIKEEYFNRKRNYGR